MDNQNTLLKINNLEASNIIYKSYSGDYKIISFISCDTKKEYTVKGEMNIREGEFVNLTIRQNYDSKYGIIFELVSYKKIIPSDKRQFIKYLSSGLFKGLNKSLANTIFSKYSLNFFNLLEKNSEKIVKELNIKVEKTQLWFNTYIQIFKFQKFVNELMNIEYSFNIANKIYNMHCKNPKLNLLDVAKKNPYYFTQYIKSFKFDDADKVFLKIGGNLNDNLRLEQMIVNFFKNHHDGNTMLPINLFLSKLRIKKFNVNLNVIKDFLANLRNQKNKFITVFDIDGIDYIFLNEYLFYENFISKKLLELSNNSICSKDEANKILKQLNTEIKLKLTDKQVEAVINGLTKGFSIITGGPGTGKTTVLNSIKKAIEIYNKYNKSSLSITMLAPTGRAAKRILESTQHISETIHKKLMLDRNGNFGLNEENPIEERIIIVDEMSMVDVNIFHALLKAVKSNAILILVGDKDQLQSIGAGNILKDVIESEKFPTITLDIIKRQSGEENTIPYNAKLINTMNFPDYNEKDFFIIKRVEEQSIIATLKQILTKNIYNLNEKIDILNDLQIITPTKTFSRLINIEIQNLLNPLTQSKKEIKIRNNLFRVGDKVINTTNNYDVSYDIIDIKSGNIKSQEKGIMNGEIGIITEITNNKEIVILFDNDHMAYFKEEDCKNLELAYSITVHKCQGCEYKIIIMIVSSFIEVLMTKNLFYTAVTRAKDIVINIGPMITYKRMSMNIEKTKRFTSLKTLFTNKEFESLLI